MVFYRLLNSFPAACTIIRFMMHRAYPNGGAVAVHNVVVQKGKMRRDYSTILLSKANVSVAVST